MWFSLFFLGRCDWTNEWVYFWNKSGEHQVQVYPSSSSGNQLGYGILSETYAGFSSKKTVWPEGLGDEVQGEYFTKRIQKMMQMRVDSKMKYWLGSHPFEWYDMA